MAEHVHVWERDEARWRSADDAPHLMRPGENGVWWGGILRCTGCRKPWPGEDLPTPASRNPGYGALEGVMSVTTMVHRLRTDDALADRHEQLEEQRAAAVEFEATVAGSDW